MQLAFWSCALAIGIAGGLVAGRTAASVLAAVACAVLGGLVWQRTWNLGLAALAFLLGLALGHGEAVLAAGAAPVVEDQEVEVVGQITRRTDGVEPSPGLVEGAPAVGTRAARAADQRSHLRIDVAKVDGSLVAASLALTVLGGVAEPVPGDWVRFRCRLYLPRGSANPGLPDGHLLARGRGIDLVGSVAEPISLQRIPGPTGLLSLARRLAYRLRTAMCRAIDRRLDEPAAGFVRTMVVGERSDVPAAVEDGFRAAGATHVLSVSGLHLAVVVALLFQGFRRGLALFPGLALRVAPRALASALALPATAFYALLTGEAVATVRAALMAAVVLGAAVVNRPFSLPAGIGLAAMILLVKSPASLLDVSFQLSFASVIALGMFARWLVGRGMAVRATGLRWLGAWLVRVLSASVAACLMTMPIVAHHFGEITPAAPLGNILLVPLVELIVLPCGLAGALLALVHPWLGALPLLVAGVASELALALADGFRRFAPVFLVRFPNTRETLLLVTAAGCLLRAAQVGTRTRISLVLAGVFFSLGMGSLAAREAIRRTRADVLVTFLDVGQGSATLIQGPLGFVALVDGGGRYDGRFDTGARIIEPVLRAAGIPALDLVVLSHAHPDHLNGLLRILGRFPVGALWLNGEDGGNPAYASLLALAKMHKIPTPSPGVVARAGLRVEAIGPRYGDGIGVPPGLSINDGSLVIRVSFAGHSVLLPGDIGKEGEAELIEGNSRDSRQLAADVLAMPHHGSRHASTPGFLDAVSPRLTVASAGRFNRFSLPSPAVLRRYRDRGISVLRTDRAGAVIVTLDSMGQLRTVCVRGCHP